MNRISLPIYLGLLDLFHLGQQVKAGIVLIYIPDILN